MNERDFEISGHKFKLNKIDVLRQHRIAKRISPVLTEVASVAMTISKMDPNLSDNEKFDHIIKNGKPVIDAYAKLSDESSDFLLIELCSSVEIFQAQTNNWARVARDGMILFSALDLMTLYKIAGRAFMYNLGGFINTNQQISHVGK